MLAELSDTLLAALIGLAGGIALGLAAERGRFCTLGAIEDALYGHDLTRLRMWALALGLAIPAVFLLAEAGRIDLDATLYARVAWNPVSAVPGGLLFGYGMALAGNCGYGALARAGMGDLRSVVILMILGISAYATVAGPVALLRDAVFPEDAGGGADGYAHFLGRALGTEPLWPALGLGGLMAVWALSSAEARSLRVVIWSAVVAGAIASAFWGTTWLAERSLEAIPVSAHSYTTPIGGTILWLMTASGGGAGFFTGSVLGVVAGAALGASLRGRFRWEACDDPRELGRQMLGAALMGIGGVLALGCSVGQGLSAFATLSWSAPVVLAAIVAGAALGLRHLIEGFRPA